MKTIIKILVFPFILVAVTVLTATCKKDDYIYVSNVTIDKTSLTLLKGYSTRIKETILPANATNQIIIWKSSNNEVVTVNENGELTGIETGTADITVITDCGNKTATCTVTVLSGSSVSIVTSSDITLNITELIITKGDKAKLKANFNNVAWSSSNTEIVTVCENGELAAVGEGMANITATVEDGSQTATCAVTVLKTAVAIVPTTNVTLGTAELTLAVGDTEKLTASVVPGNATYKEITWISSNPDVAAVNDEGEITAVSIGTAVIIVTTRYGGKTAICTVIVPAIPQIPVTGISLDKTALTLAVGETEKLTATIEPDNATNKDITWISSNTDVAQVNDEGELVAASEGIAVIVATTKYGGKTAICTVTVPAAPKVAVTDITLNYTVLALLPGNQAVLKAIIEPADATGKTVLWTSSNTNIATVSENGTVNAVAEGTAVIVATAKYGGNTATCTVTVTAKQMNIYVNPFDYPQLRPEVSLDLSGSGAVTIDWGDGTPLESVMIKSSYLACHGYFFANPRTATIIGENITGLCILSSMINRLNLSKNTVLTNFRTDCNASPLQFLDLGNNIALTDLNILKGFSGTSIDLSNNVLLNNMIILSSNLRKLDLSNNTALTNIEYSGVMTAAALNALFETLHDNNLGTKMINISNNPGAKDCDTNIAEKRGWEVRYSAIPLFE